MVQFYGKLKKEGTVGDMDNFMDRLAQKFNAQEMIKANSQAEAEEMKRLQLQVTEYERILQEIRKLIYKNTELSEQFETMIGDNAEKIHAMKEDEQRLISLLRDITDEQTRNREADLAKKQEEKLEKEKNAESELMAVTKLLDEKFQSSDDFVHKENVKVYRNVQAVVVDEFRKYSENSKAGASEVKTAIESVGDGLKGKLTVKLNMVMAVSVVSAIASIGAVVLCALMAAGIIK